MTPQEVAWDRWHAKGMATHKPVELMHALLDSYAEYAALKEAVRAFVMADPDAADKVLTFAAMVRLVSEEVAHVPHGP